MDTTKYASHFDKWFAVKKHRLNLWLTECKARSYAALRALTNPSQRDMIAVGSIIHCQVDNRPAQGTDDRVRLTIEISLLPDGLNYWHKATDLHGQLEIYGMSLYYDPAQD